MEKSRQKAEMGMNLTIRSSFKILTLILLWIHACSSSDPKLSPTMLQLKAVKDKILDGYDKDVRPIIAGSNMTTVLMQLIPRQILDVDEEKGIFELDSYLIMGWHDPRLTWDTGLNYMQMPPDSFWLPDISIYNSHSKPVDPLNSGVQMYMELNGFVRWVPPMHTMTSCPALQQAACPGDVVECGVRIGSWVHSGRVLDYDHWRDVWLDEFLNIHSRWELLLSQVRVERNTISYDGHNDTFFCNEIIFPLRRRPSPEIEVTRSPCILVMLITLAMFWMPPDSTNKLLVGGISLSTLTVLLIYVACSTKFPPGVLFAVSFLQSTMYIVVVSILLQVLLIYNLCNMAGPSRPPAVIMQLLGGPFGVYTCLRSSPSNDNIRSLRPMEDSQSIIKQPTPNEDWILFASGLDRLFFVLMLISTIAIHHV